MPSYRVHPGVMCHHAGAATHAGALISHHVKIGSVQNCTFADLLQPLLTTDRFDAYRSESGTCWSRTTCPHMSIISAWTPRGRCAVVQDSTIRSFFPNPRPGIERSRDAKPNLEISGSWPAHSISSRYMHLMFLS